MIATAITTTLSAISTWMPRPIIEARTRCAQAMMPHCLERMILPHLPEEGQAEFIHKMVNVLLVGASRQLTDVEWRELIARLRDWTGSLNGSPHSNNLGGQDVEISV